MRITLELRRNGAATAGFNLKYEFSLDSDSTQYSGYSLRSVRVEKL